MDKAYQLIQDISEGQEIAFIELYNLYKAMVYNTALSYVQEVQVAEEITQDVFVKIYRSATTFKGGSKGSTWIYRITINQCIDAQRKKHRRNWLLPFDKVDRNAVPDFNHPGILMENKEKAKHLFAFIYSLPIKQKTAFLLAFVEQVPRQEIADVMELSLKAVESLLQRAKSNLRKKIGEEKEI